MSNSIRVRFAPSPTGKLHMGSARTALFNYLFAKKENGSFLLRIEDTDLARSTKELEDEIVEELKLLGLSWDEGPDVGGPYGPYRQSERFDIYKSYAEKLVEQEFAFYCFCTAQELEQQKHEALQSGKPPRYSGKCRHLSKQNVERGLTNQSPAIRFNVPPNKIHISDKIRGSIYFEPESFGDFIIIKSDGSPTYNFAAAIDDALMEITHVIRGEDHLTNTARQILIYNAIGKTPPNFIHIGLILGTDKSKLSKRHGATSVGEYLEQGYLPEVIANFLSLLGWSDPEGIEIFSNINAIAQRFSLDRLSPSPSIFDIEKMTWMNGEHIRGLTDEQLRDRVIPFLLLGGLEKPPHITDNQKTSKWLTLLSKSIKDNLHVLSEAPILTAIFFKETVEIPVYLQSELKGPIAVEAIKLLIDKIQPFKADEIDLDFDLKLSSSLINDIRTYFKENGVGVKKFLHPLRIALTGEDSGVPIINVITLLGKERVLNNLQKALSLK